MLTLKPVTLKVANAMVQRLHRHSVPVVGCKFAAGVEAAGVLVGVGIAGRPVARLLDDGYTLEILRVCTDGTPNACSILYGSLRAAGRKLGYRRVITYTLATEPGASLLAVGGRRTGAVEAQEWGRPSRPRASGHQAAERVRWEL
jgi:hypothetical protein